jgi:peptidoglycan/xylan/chitin deacetylase (PgdA/CDA1 family)
MFHSNYREEHLLESRKILQDITNQPIEGFRMPRLQPVSTAALADAGYRYNSSLNPTYIPGRYNNLTRKRTYHDDGAILNIPTAVTPLIRFPIFWLTLKVFPLSVIQLATSLNLRWDRYLCTYCHPWEFADISSVPIPRYLRTPCGEAMNHKFTKYLHWLGAHGDFMTCGQFAKLIRTGNQL